MLKKLLILSAAAFLCLPVIASAAQVSLFVGKVTLLRDGKKTPVRVGNKLHTGDVIKTGKDSLMEIKDNIGGTIKILAMSIMTIGSKKIAGSDSLSLIMGDLSAMFTKLKRGSTKIYSPTTIAAVRGTEFTMSVSSGGDARIDLKAGLVDVSSPYGATSIRENENVETRVGEAPRPGSGTAEEWKKASEESFTQNPGAKAQDTEKYLETLDERGKETDSSMITVRSSIESAANKEALEKLESLLNNTEEKTKDDLILNESLGESLKNTMENFKEKNETLYSRYRSIYVKSNRVAAQQQKNLESLKKVRQEYQKARQRIMGRYKDKIDEIKTKFKDKKSNI